MNSSHIIEVAAPIIRAALNTKRLPPKICERRFERLTQSGPFNVRLFFSAAEHKMAYAL